MTSRESGHTGPHTAGHTAPAAVSHTAPTGGAWATGGVTPAQREVVRVFGTPKHTSRGDNGGALLSGLRTGLVVITSPIGFPFHGVRLLSSHLRFIERLQPAALVNIGGLFAALPAADGRGGERTALLKSVAREYLSPLRAVYKGPVAMPGLSGHVPIPRQTRLRRDVESSADMAEMLAEFEVAELPRHVELLPGWVIACAALGVRRRSTVGATALAEARKLGVNVVCGCSGFLGSVSETRGPSERRQTLRAVEVGHLRVLNHRAERQRSPFGRGPGFVVLEVEDGVVKPVLVPMKPNGAFSYGGEKFGLLS
jgi:hypothetical protein